MRAQRLFRSTGIDSEILLCHDGACFAITQGTTAADLALMEFAFYINPSGRRLLENLLVR
jgi:hypothetical protein